MLILILVLQGRLMSDWGAAELVRAELAQAHKESQATKEATEQAAAAHATQEEVQG